MELQIEYSDGRTIELRDARPIVEPDVLRELLAALAVDEPAEAGDAHVVLPFGFTKIANEDAEAE